MKHSIIFFLIIGVAMIFWGCSENQPTSPELSQSDQVMNTMAKKPAAKLIGPMDLTFDLTRAPYYWDGTVDFGDYGVYGIRFESLGGRDVGQAHHFIENFEIYDLITDAVCLGGPDAGVTTLANSKFRMNGVVEVVNTPFEEWLGRSVHISGLIIWGATGPPPVAGVGTVRIN